MRDEQGYRPMRKDCSQRLESQEDCGHWGRIDREYEYAHLIEGFCPPCRQPLTTHESASGEHLHCKCCGQCWRLHVDGFGSVCNCFYLSGRLLAT